MSLGKLIIDKSSVDLNYLFKALKIVEEKNGIIDRFSFVVEMEYYMHGESQSFIEGTEQNRTQFNKTKLARYYGLLRTTKYENTQYIILTKRGKEICKIIKEMPNNEFYVTDQDELIKIILLSVLYDTFGKNNDGVEQSSSDVEPPKILLKSILDLGYITSEELIYLIYALNNGDYETYGDAIQHIREIRKFNNDEYLINKIDEFNKKNFVRDNKLIKFFEKIGIIFEDEKRYFLYNDIYEKYVEIIKKLDPTSKNLQMIIMGNPGSGKSHYINDIILGNIVETKQVVRTIIYPDYTYSDFVGHIKPLTINKKIYYEFEPGPFTIALEKCLKNPKTNIYLVTEEINRGNISEIFGDLFQLLDRIDDFKSDSHGKSKYFIKNKEIYNYLSDSLTNKQIKYLEDEKIVLPSNFNIIMTLNNSEQNDYFIDSAFRRRFNYLYLRNDDISLNKNYLQEIDNISKKNIFNNDYTWTEFRKRINKKIDEFNKEIYTIPESKKLAPFFVNMDDLSNKEQFCDKVIYYLKNDVFKYNENILNKNYDSIRDLFINGEDFFEIMED